MSIKLLSFCRSARFIATVHFQCVRRMASRADTCAVEIRPPCSPENTAKKVCQLDRINELMASSFFNKECCNNPCPDAMPRFDDIYYKSTDKLKRKYQQTWCEPIAMKIEPQPVCKNSDDDLPLPEVRQRKTRTAGAKAACEASENNLDLMQCRTKLKAGACPRLTLPGCRAARIPPKCNRNREPTDCQKVCTPYPAYSECIRDDPPPRRPTECKCLYLEGFCAEGAPLMPKPTEKILP